MRNRETPQTVAVVISAVVLQFVLALIIARTGNRPITFPPSDSAASVPGVTAPERQPVSRPQAGESFLYVQYILDASESMLETMPDGISKRESADQALVTHLLAIPSETRTGLRLYGHRISWHRGQAESCQDIELVVPVEVGQFEAIRTRLGDYENLGETPLHASLQAAIGGMDLTDPQRYNTIVLISDGRETCGGDPCALVKAARTENLNLIFHAIGMDVDEATRRQLECIATEGGGNWFDVRSQEALESALTALAGSFGNTDPVPPPVAAVMPPTAPAVPAAQPTRDPWPDFSLDVLRNLTYSGLNDSASSEPVTLENGRFDKGFLDEIVLNEAWSGRVTLSGEQLALAFVETWLQGSGGIVITDLAVVGVRDGEWINLFTEQAVNEGSKWPESSWITGMEVKNDQLILSYENNLVDDPSVTRIRFEKIWFWNGERLILLTDDSTWQPPPGEQVVAHYLDDERQFFYSSIAADMSGNNRYIIENRLYRFDLVSETRSLVWTRELEPHAYLPWGPIVPHMSAGEWLVGELYPCWGCDFLEWEPSIMLINLRTGNIFYQSQASVETLSPADNSFTWRRMEAVQTPCDTNDPHCEWIGGYEITWEETGDVIREVLP